MTKPSELQQGALIRFNTLMCKRFNNFIHYFRFIGNTNLLCLDSIHIKMIKKCSIESIDSIEINYANRHIIFHGLKIKYNTQSFNSKQKIIKMYFPTIDSKNYTKKILEQKTKN